MNPSVKKPVCGLNSWGKEVASGHFAFLSVGLHLENLVSPKNMSVQPDNKSGLSRSTESPGDAFLCVRETREYKVINAWTLIVLLKIRTHCARVCSDRRRGSFCTAQTGLQTIFPCRLARCLLVMWFVVVTDCIVFHSPCVSSKCHHC